MKSQSCPPHTRPWWPTFAASLLAACASPCESPAPATPSTPLASDANGNGVDDWVDIAVGTSLDENANAVPDEVEAHFSVPPFVQDGNGNGIEDCVDIVTGYSQDANQNSIPDEVEAEHAHHANTAAGPSVQPTRKL